MCSISDIRPDAITALHACQLGVAAAHKHCVDVHALLCCVDACRLCQCYLPRSFTRSHTRCFHKRKCTNTYTHHHEHTCASNSTHFVSSIRHIHSCSHSADHFRAQQRID